MLLELIEILVNITLQFTLSVDAYACAEKSSSRGQDKLLFSTRLNAPERPCFAFVSLVAFYLYYILQTRLQNTRLYRSTRCCH